MSDAINYIAMVLSVVSLIVTIVGFFASLKFYRDGVELQGKANEALTKLAEKTDFIQTQVGGMFDKTLDAAIGKRVMLSENFQELNAQIDEAKTKLVEETIGQIGAAGEAERKRLSEIVDGQINLIREKVDNARDSAADIFEPVPMSPLSHLHSSVLTSLQLDGGAARTFPAIADFCRKSSGREISEDEVRNVLSRYVKKNWVKKVHMGANEMYVLTPAYWDAYEKSGR